MPVRKLSRRTVLRGAGAAVGLPLLEAMVLPWRQANARAAGAVVAPPPVRLAWLQTTSGVRMPRFTPAKTGADYELTPILAPLKAFKQDVSVLSGLFHAGAFKTVPSVGRHEQDPMCHLTGADLGRIPGVGAKNAVSVDQVAGRHLGEQTRLPTLNLAAFGHSKLVYDEAGTPIPADWQPPAVWDRLFVPAGGDPAERARRDGQDDGVLDRVTESTRRLNARLGAGDRHKVDEYLTGLREVEKRVRTARAWGVKPPVAVPDGAKRPAANPDDLTARIRLLMDLAVLAFQTDQTRAVTLHLGSMDCRYPDIGCPDQYHGYTHTGHKDFTDDTDPMARVDRKRVEHLAYFLGRLRAVKEGERDLLHASLVHYGSGMGLGHETTDLPNLLAGHGGGAVRPGRHVDYGGRPLADLYVRMLQAAGVPAKRFADSTGPLAGV